MRAQDEYRPRAAIRVHVSVVVSVIVSLSSPPSRLGPVVVEVLFLVSPVWCFAVVGAATASVATNGRSLPG
jgi:hypothetical protein